MTYLACRRVWPQSKDAECLPVEAATVLMRGKEQLAQLHQVGGGLQPSCFVCCFFVRCSCGLSSWWQALATAATPCPAPPQFHLLKLVATFALCTHNMHKKVGEAALEGEAACGRCDAGCLLAWHLHGVCLACLQMNKEVEETNSKLKDSQGLVAKLEKKASDRLARTVASCSPLSC